MQQTAQAATNGSAVSAPPGVPVELEELRASCRRQARVIETLSAAIGTLQVGARALKAENADLRAEQDRGHRTSSQHTESVEVRLALDIRAPAVARAAVADRLGTLVSAAVLDDAQLVVSELVTNSVCHSGATNQKLTLRLELSASMVRLEIEDPGDSGAVAPRPTDLNGGGGLGLKLVQAMSERWGVERAAVGGTRVWAQLAL
jgi:anti-sigma regulatory factor (Ser/Thr protein kinase)